MKDDEPSAADPTGSADKQPIERPTVYVEPADDEPIRPTMWPISHRTEAERRPGASQMDGPI